MLTWEGVGKYLALDIFIGFLLQTFTLSISRSPNTVNQM